MIDVQKLTKEARLGSVLSHNGGSERIWIEGADWQNEVEHLICLVLEEAAKVCDDLWQEDGTAMQCREAIRALKPNAQ